MRFWESGFLLRHLFWGSISFIFELYHGKSVGKTAEARKWSTIFINSYRYSPLRISTKRHGGGRRVMIHEMAEVFVITEWLQRRGHGKTLSLHYREKHATPHAARRSQFNNFLLLLQMYQQISTNFDRNINLHEALAPSAQANKPLTRLPRRTKINTLDNQMSS
jgi:hypothetical protein